MIDLSTQMYNMLRLSFFISVCSSNQGKKKDSRKRFILEMYN